MAYHIFIQIENNFINNIMAKIVFDQYLMNCLRMSDHDPIVRIWDSMVQLWSNSQMKNIFSVNCRQKKLHACPEYNPTDPTFSSCLQRSCFNAFINTQQGRRMRLVGLVYQQKTRIYTYIIIYIQYIFTNDWFCNPVLHGCIPKMMY